jgi:hypothetical protein
MRSRDEKIAPRQRNRLVLNSQAVDAVNYQEGAVGFIAPGIDLG